jgi:Holliday junction resolvase RusA-like endonuclease
MSEVRDAWNSLALPPFAKDTDLALGLRIFCKRPDSHYRANGLLKDWALNARPKTGTNGGDVSNFVKLVEDALNAVAYHDDSQIAEYLTPFGKWYAAPQEMPRTEITLALAEPVTFGPPTVDALAEQLALAP